MKINARPSHLIDAQHGDRPEIDAQTQMRRHVIERQRGDGKAERHQHARIHPRRPASRTCGIVSIIMNPPPRHALRPPAPPDTPAKSAETAGSARSCRKDTDAQNEHEKHGRRQSCGFFKSFNSTIGCGWRHSQMIQQIRIDDGSDRTPPMIQCEANQSFSWPLSSTICRHPTPSATSPSPM